MVMGLSTMTEMLTVYRRHAEACPHADQGRAWLKCKCPLWVDGILDGREMRRSLKTRNLQRAYADAERMEGGKMPSQPKPIAELLNQWLATVADKAPETRKKYKRVAALLGEFCRARGVTAAGQIGIEDIDAYPAWRECAAITLRKELETIKAILAWAIERGWLAKQPVKRSHMVNDIRLKAGAPKHPNSVGSIMRRMMKSRDIEIVCYRKSDRPEPVPPDARRAGGLLARPGRWPAGGGGGGDSEGGGRDGMTHKLLFRGHVPSKKNGKKAWRGRVIIDREIHEIVNGLKFQAQAMWQQAPIERAAIRAVFYVRDGKCDLDGKFTTLQDVLVQSGVLRNDSIARVPRTSQEAVVVEDGQQEWCLIEIEELEKAGRRRKR